MRQMTRDCLVAALAGAMLASGCGSDVDSGRVLGEPGAQVVVASSADGGDDAQVEGVVRLVDGCLGIGEAVAIWPSGTEVVGDDPLTIRVPGVGEVEMGDSVQGAGGYFEAGEYSGEPSLPSSCNGSLAVTFRSG